MHRRFLLLAGIAAAVVGLVLSAGASARTKRTDPVVGRRAARPTVGADAVVGRRAARPTVGAVAAHAADKQGDQHARVRH